MIPARRRPLLLAIVLAGATLGTVACDGVAEPDPDPRGTATIGPEGGVVVAPASGLFAGAVLTIPPGAVTEPTEITVEPVPHEDVPLPAGESPGRDDLISGTAYDFGPDGLEFLVPAELMIEYREEALAGRPERDLEIIRIDAAVARIPESVVDETRNTIRALVDHFTVYAAAIQAARPVSVEEQVALADIVTIVVRRRPVSSVDETVAVADVVAVNVRRPARSNVPDEVAVTDEVTIAVLRDEPAGGDAYVALSGTDSVAVIDLASRSVVEMIAVGPLPTAVAANPTRGEVYVANRGDGTVSVISSVTRTVVATIQLMDVLDPWDIAVSRDGSKAYVADAGADWIQVIDLASRSVEANLEGGPLFARSVTTDPVRERLYAGAADVVVVLDLAAGAPVDRIPVNAATASEHVAVTPDGTELWLTDDGADQVLILDLETNSQSGTIDALGGARGIAIHEDVAWVLVSPSSIVPIPVLSRVPGTPIPMEAGLFGIWIALSQDGGTAVVSEGDTGTRNRVAIVDLTAATVLATLTVGSSPAGVVVVPNE